MLGITTRRPHMFSTKTKHVQTKPIPPQIIDDCQQAIKKIATNTSNEFQETLTKFLTELHNKSPEKCKEFATKLTSIAEKTPQLRSSHALTETHIQSTLNLAENKLGISINDRKAIEALFQQNLKTTTTFAPKSNKKTYAGSSGYHYSAHVTQTGTFYEGATHKMSINITEEQNGANIIISVKSDEGSELILMNTEKLVIAYDQHNSNNEIDQCLYLGRSSHLSLQKGSVNNPPNIFLHFNGNETTPIINAKTMDRVPFSSSLLRGTKFLENGRFWTRYKDLELQKLTETSEDGFSNWAVLHSGKISGIVLMKEDQENNLAYATIYCGMDRVTSTYRFGIPEINQPPTLVVQNLSQIS